MKETRKGDPFPEDPPRFLMFLVPLTQEGKSLLETIQMI
jgi:hypothetical protein